MWKSIKEREDPEVPRKSTEEHAARSLVLPQRVGDRFVLKLFWSLESASKGAALLKKVFAVRRTQSVESVNSCCCGKAAWSGVQLFLCWHSELLSSGS